MQINKDLRSLCVIILLFFVFSALGKGAAADPFEENGKLMLRAIRGSNIFQMRALLGTGFVDPNGAEIDGSYVYFLDEAARGSVGVEALELLLTSGATHFSQFGCTYRLPSPYVLIMGWLSSRNDLVDSQTFLVALDDASRKLELLIEYGVIKDSGGSEAEQCIPDFSAFDVLWTKRAAWSMPCRILLTEPIDILEDAGFDLNAMRNEVNLSTGQPVPRVNLLQMFLWQRGASNGGPCATLSPFEAAFLAVRNVDYNVLSPSGYALTEMLQIADPPFGTGRLCNIISPTEIGPILSVLIDLGASQPNLPTCHTGSGCAPCL